MNFRSKYDNIDLLTSQLEKTDDQCHIALYLHRIYLNTEELIEFFLTQKQISVEHDGSYHKMVLKFFYKEIQLEEELYKLLEEMRGFRHIFVKRSDIWCFDTGKLIALKNSYLQQKSIFLKMLKEVFL